MTFLSSRENYKQMWVPQGGVEEGARASFRKTEQRIWKRRRGWLLKGLSCS